MSHTKNYNMLTRGVHGDVNIGGVIDTSPPADKIGKLSLEENVRAAAKAYSDALDGDPDAQWAASVWAIGMSNLRADGDDDENEALLQAALLAANDALLDALALDPVVQAEPALIGLYVPALPEVVAPAAMPKPAAPLVPVVISPSVAEPANFNELFADEGGETDVTGQRRASVVPEPAALRAARPQPRRARRTHRRARARRAARRRAQRARRP